MAISYQGPEFFTSFITVHSHIAESEAWYCDPISQMMRMRLAEINFSTPGSLTADVPCSIPHRLSLLLFITYFFIMRKAQRRGGLLASCGSYEMSEQCTNGASNWVLCPGSGGVWG